MKRWNSDISGWQEFKNAIREEDVFTAGLLAAWAIVLIPILPIIGLILLLGHGFKRIVR